MGHNALVERAARWLGGTMGCGIVLREFAAYITSGEIPDVIGWTKSGNALRPAEWQNEWKQAINVHRGWSILVECKASRADFRREASKRARRFEGAPGNRIGQERWYFTPAGLLNTAEIPDGWGLAEVHGRMVLRMKEPARVRQDAEIAAAEMPLLMSVVRRLGEDMGVDVIRRKALLVDDD